MRLTKKTADYQYLLAIVDNVVSDGDDGFNGVLNCGVVVAVVAGVLTTSTTQPSNSNEQAQKLHSYIKIKSKWKSHNKNIQCELKKTLFDRITS